MKILYIIPARGGSKGIPRKNIKPLNGKPLLDYSIDVARKLTTDENICVSTDDDEIIKCAEDYGLKVPFKRPDYLATDTCGTYDVLLHAVNFYQAQGKNYDVLLLLQPTSPFRTCQHIKEAIAMYSNEIDMVVGVKEASCNPYYNCFLEGEDGYLKHLINNQVAIRRQDAPKTWEYNGALYVINIQSLLKMPLSDFSKVRKYPMDDIHSIDLDTMLDWHFAEFIFKENLI